MTHKTSQTGSHLVKREVFKGWSLWDFKNLACVKSFGEFVCFFVFVIVFVPVFVFLVDFCIAFIKSFQNMYGSSSMWSLRAVQLIMFEVMTDSHSCRKIYFAGNSCTFKFTFFLTLKCKYFTLSGEVSPSSFSIIPLRKLALKPLKFLLYISWSLHRLG